VAFDLISAIGVHSLMATQIRELGVRLETNFALEWFD
jgi:hypothetical protein